MNTRTFCCFAFVFFYLIQQRAYAQTYPEDIRYRFAYDFTFRRYEGDKKKHELKYLDISKSYVKFESANQLKKLERMDSLHKKGMNTDAVLSECSKVPISLDHSIIIKNIPSRGTRTIVDFVLRSYAYTEPVEKINWQTETGDTLICDFECHKARCSFRGRNWTAWYCKDIPIHEGPWKLIGLPGLILSACDDSGDFSFVCVGMYEPKGVKIRIINTNDYGKCTRREMLKAQQRLMEDPNGLERSMGVQSYNADGTPLKYKPRKAILLENE